MTRIFIFWAPLAATWILMAMEPPLVNAVIARMEQAKENLAAFGVTFAVAIIIESPIIMMLSATTALAGGMSSYRRLLSFMHIMAVGLSAVHLLIGITPLYEVIVGRVLGAPDQIVEISRKAFLFMTPWAAAVGYRRLWQGLLIRFGRTGVVPITMAIRLGATGGGLILGLITAALSGANLAALALSVGVITGAVVSYGYARSTIRMQLVQGGADTPLSWKSFLVFYVPLSLTSIIYLLVQPILTFGIARASFPLESLAVWPVMYGYLFLYRAIAISLQDATVALSRDSENIPALRTFTLLVAGVLTAIYLLVALTPLSRGWFRGVSGLSPELYQFTKIPVIILTVICPASCFVSLYSGILIQRNRTPTVTAAVAVNAFFLIFVVLIGNLLTDLPGTILAAVAFSASMVSQFIYLRVVGWGAQGGTGVPFASGGSRA